MIILATALAIGAIALGMFALRVFCDHIAFVIRKHRTAVQPQPVAPITCSMIVWNHRRKG